MIHIQHPRLPDGIGNCGESGRCMSHHEIKRGRITCTECIRIELAHRQGDPPYPRIPLPPNFEEVS